MHHLKPTLGLALAGLLACGDDNLTTVTDGATSTGTTAAPMTDPSVGPGGDPTTLPTTTTTPTEGTVSDGVTGTTTGTTAGPGETTDATGTTAPVATEGGETTVVDTTTTSGTTTTGETTTDTSAGETEDTTTGVAEACECPDLEVPLDDGIFVLSDIAELWKYFPETNTFEMLGSLNCDVGSNTFSMAVDRQGFAWVQFTLTGELRKVDVTDVSNCEDPGFAPGQLGVDNFGMAFVSNSAADKCDRIYGNTYSGIGGYTEGVNVGDFMTIDPVTLQVSKLGKTNFDGAELTGTGDGRAFIFGGANPSKLVEADKANGAALDVLPLNGLEINNGAFAFAFFAGDFYFFTDSDNDFFNSEVTHLDYDDSDNNGKQDLTVLTENAPLLIVGAGVSTCAPTLPQ